jgi:LuxR family maltose regulon positive regulatory protein
MHSLLNVTKVLPPRLPAILPRPRLLARLEQYQNRKLILVLGPAAQGKTTLTASYMQQSPLPSAWLNLGPEDSEAVNLFYLLGQSLQRTFPRVDFSPALAYPSMAMGPREELPLFQDWLLALFQPLHEPVQVVFDGLDRLNSQAPAFRLLQVLLDIAPPHLHLYLLSRELPSLQFEALKIGQEAFILDGRDLAFTLKETREFLADIRGFSLSAKLVKTMHQVTEGWIGGLILLSEALERLPAEARESYLVGDVPKKFSRDICPYFSEQVFSSHPAQVQEVLLSSAVLDTVEPEFLQKLVGRDDARDILEELARKNLFIQSVYDKKRGWLYRYHQLFRDFLLSKFQTDWGEAARRAAYFRAGELFGQQGELEQAVKYYLKARAYAEAAAALVKVGLDLIMAGRTGDLAQWLAPLPEELLQGNPWLLFYRYVSVRFSGPSEILADLQQARAMFQEQGEVRGSLLALAFLLEATSLRTHKDLGPIPALLEQGEALAQSEGAQAYPFERALLLSHLGFASYLRGGVPLKGAWACRQAYLLARDLGNVFLQALTLMHEYFAYALLGNISGHENIKKQLDKLFEKFSFPELSPYYFINLGQSLLFQGEFLKAAELLKQARDEIERHGLTYLYPPILMCELWMKAYLPEAQDTEEIANTVVNISLTVRNIFVQGLGFLMLGENRYQRGNFPEAQEALRRAREILGSEEGRAEMQWSWTKVLLALVASHLQGNGSVERELEETLAHFTQISSHMFLREAHLAMALWKWRHGQAEAAALHLETGLKLGERHGYHFSFMLNKKDMLQVCLLALELQLEETWDYVSNILKTRLADLAGPALERLSRHAHARVADRAREIRVAIHRAQAPRLRIQTLGGFWLFRGDEEVKDKEWEGHQPKLLLKALLAHRPGEVPKDVLMEDLWPESSPEAAEKNFKVNLHRLRKALEPNLDKTFGSSYVHLKANLLSLDSELCQLDAEEFLSRCREAEKLALQGEVERALERAQQAVELYGGDFLAQELYQPWAERKRADLRETYLGLLQRVAALEERQGALTRAIHAYKRVIQADPLHEEACRGLMQLYARRGNRSAALRVYADLKKALGSELNAEPDEVTSAIYQKILETPTRQRPQA